MILTTISTNDTTEAIPWSDKDASQVQATVGKIYEVTKPGVIYLTIVGRNDKDISFNFGLFYRSFSPNPITTPLTPPVPTPPVPTPVIPVPAPVISQPVSSPTVVPVSSPQESSPSSVP